VPAAYLTLAVEKWNLLSEGERKDYIEKHKHEFDAIAPQEEGGAAIVEEVEALIPEEPAADGGEEPATNGAEPDIAVSSLSCREALGCCARGRLEAE
jgi:hypothetical protein